MDDINNTSGDDKRGGGVAMDQQEEEEVSSLGNDNDVAPLVELRLSQPKLLNKTRNQSIIWSAVHTLITTAIGLLATAETETAQEEEEEGEIAVVAEGKQTENEQAKASAVVKVMFANGYFEDPSGLWTQVLEAQAKSIDYTAGSDIIVGFAPDVAAALLLSQNPIVRSQGKRNGCFNCGDTSHTVAQCPEPLDRRRIAEAREEQFNSGSGGNARYHGGSSDKPNNSLKAKYPDVMQGVLSPALRNALGIMQDEASPLERIKERLGPPPQMTSSNSASKGGKKPIDDEPLLTIINDPNEVQEKEGDERSTGEDGEIEEKMNEEDQATVVADEPSTSKCKKTGNEIWDNRMLPLCTCGTETPCKRAASTGPVTPFAEERLVSVPSLLSQAPVTRRDRASPPRYDLQDGWPKGNTDTASRRPELAYRTRRHENDDSDRRGSYSDRDRDRRDRRRSSRSRSPDRNFDDDRRRSRGRSYDRYAAPPPPPARAQYDPQLAQYAPSSYPPPPQHYQQQGYAAPTVPVYSPMTAPPPQYIQQHPGPQNYPYIDSQHQSYLNMYDQRQSAAAHTPLVGGSVPPPQPPGSGGYYPPVQYGQQQQQQHHHHQPVHYGQL